MNARHLLGRDFPSRRITSTVQPTVHLQPFGRGRAGNQANHRFVVAQRFATPVGRNKREQPVFDFIPFAGPGRKVADRNFQARLVGQPLQLPFPKPHAVAVTAPAISRNEQASGLRIQLPAFVAPPTPNGSHGKAGRIVIGSHIDKTRIPSQIVDAVRISARHRRIGKIKSNNRGQANPMDFGWDAGYLSVKLFRGRREHRTRDTQEPGNGKPSAKLRLQFAVGGVHASGGEKTEDRFLIGCNALAGRVHLTNFGIGSRRTVRLLAQNRLHTTTPPLFAPRNNPFHKFAGCSNWQMIPICATLSRRSIIAFPQG